MASPMQANLDSTGIRDRMITGPCRMLLCGDSICEPLNPARFYSGLLRIMEGPALRGLILGGGIHVPAGAGYLVEDRPVVNVSKQTLDPDEAGNFSAAVNILPTSREEYLFAASAATDDDMYRVQADDNLKTGGLYEYAAFGDWIEGQNMTHTLIYLQHADGVDSLALRNFRQETGAGFTVTGTNDTTFSTSGTTALAKVSIDLDSTTTGDWLEYGSQVYTPASSPASGKGFIPYANHLYVRDATDGIHIGSLSRSGLRSAGYLAAMDLTSLTNYILWTKADTFFLTLGTNDGTDDIAAATYGTNIEAIIDRFVTASAAARALDGSILVPKFCLVAMYASGGGTPRTKMGDYADTLYAISQSNCYSDKAAFINLYRAMGSSSVIGEFHLADSTHPSEEGSLAFTSAIMSQVYGPTIEDMVTSQRFGRTPPGRLTVDRL